MAISWDRRGALGLLPAVVLLAGCPQHGIVDDGTSISYGPSNRGKLMRPTRLPARGTGYEIPKKWRRRGLNYGTDEAVALVVDAGRRLRQAIPGAVMQVADLSRRRGGPSRWHRSHQSGRDIDVLFLARNGAGKFVRLQDMVRFDRAGRAMPETAPAGAEIAAETGDEDPQDSEPDLFFDVASNWILVKTLIQNPISEVQYIFVYEPLKQLLLDHAQRIGEPGEIVARASFLLRQPSDSAPHDDHFHLRIYCTRSDRGQGCQDRGSLRWTKKDYKYPREHALPVTIPASMPMMIVILP